MAKLTDKAVIAAIIKAGGNVSAAARKLNVCRAAVTKRMANNPKIREAVDDAMESLIDNAVSVIEHHIKKKSFAAAKHVTETIGRNRGWIRTEDLRAELAAWIQENEKMRAENVELRAQLQRALAAIAPGSRPIPGSEPERTAGAAGADGNSAASAR